MFHLLELESPDLDPLSSPRLVNDYDLCSVYQESKVLSSFAILPQNLQSTSPSVQILQQEVGGKLTCMSMFPAYYQMRQKGLDEHIPCTRQRREQHTPTRQVIHMVIKKRLDVSINGELRDYIRDEAQRLGKPMNVVSDELLAYAIAHRCAERIERQSLSLVREVVSTELHFEHARLRAEIREDMRLELLEETKATEDSHDELANVLSRILHEVRTVRRMLYPFIAHEVDPQFAAQVFDDARKKTGKSVPPNSVSEGA